MAREKINKGFAEMFKNGVIMDVTNDEQARIAEDAGACSVMALERVPSDIRKDGQVARMSDPAMIQAIMDVTNAEQARIAEDAGACSVMATRRPKFTSAWNTCAVDWPIAMSDPGQTARSSSWRAIQCLVAAT